MKRRAFIETGIFTAVGSIFQRLAAAGQRADESPKLQESGFWKGSGFHQETVDGSMLESGQIRARIDGKWASFQIRPLNEDFYKWNFEDRLEKLEKMRTGSRPEWSGAHNAAVATVGKQRGDSVFTLNNAIKGMGPCPKLDRIKPLIARLKESAEKPVPERLDVLLSMYQDRDLWDPHRLVSLELYSKPDFETHTFLNQMENPVSTVVFLDVPSFEIRTISQLFHPEDPDLSDFGRLHVEYINTIHTFMHSHFKAIVPAVVYHVIELFDNSPGGSGKRGERIV